MQLGNNALLPTSKPSEKRFDDNKTMKCKYSIWGWSLGGVGGGLAAILLVRLLADSSFPLLTLVLLFFWSGSCIGLWAGGKLDDGTW